MVVALQAKKPRPNSGRAAIVAHPVWRFTVDEYQRLAELDILGEDDDVELLAGVITPKIAHNPPHDSVLDLIIGALQEILPQGWYIRSQNAIATADSATEPEVAVVRGPRGRYRKKHPGPKDIALTLRG